MTSNLTLTGLKVTKICFPVLKSEEISSPVLWVWRYVGVIHKCPYATMSVSQTSDDRF